VGIIMLYIQNFHHWPTRLQSLAEVFHDTVDCL